MSIRTYISIITFNVNGLNAPAKIQRLAEWIQKRDPCIFYLQETHFSARDTYKLAFFFSFSGLQLRHMVGPTRGVESELQPPAYATATAMPDLSCVCNLYHSSQQHQTLNLLSEARDHRITSIYTATANNLKRRN